MLKGTSLFIAMIFLSETAWSGGNSQAGSTAKVFNLQQAVEYALAHHPAVAAFSSQRSAEAAAINLARTAYLPRTDLLLAFNRATRNNIFGMVLPQRVIPAISGPVLDQSSYGGTWGSATGALLSWQFMDFGRREAQVEVAGARHGQANANLAREQFRVALEVADAFLALIATREQIRTAEANVQRMQVFLDSVAVLVRNQLRPGADESRARAELAQAQIQLVRARQREQEVRATFSERMGLGRQNFEVVTGPLLETPPEFSSAPLDQHPSALAQEAAITVSRSRQDFLQRSFHPRFDLVAGLYSRGSGARTDGTFWGGLSGLAMDRSNWGVGVNITLPIFDFASLREEKRIEAFKEQAETARYDVIMQQLAAQVERARAAVDGTRRVAETTPIQLEAARMLETQARARYQSGLATVLEVAEAQRLLTNAEVEDTLARLQIWRAWLDLTGAQGDIRPFLQKSTGGP